jgi:hypothetical protein
VLHPKTAHIGAYVVGGWLGAVAVNLIANRDYDIAVRDIVMGIGAFALGRFLARRAAVRAEQRSTPEPNERAPMTQRVDADKRYAMH